MGKDKLPTNSVDDKEHGESWIVTFLDLLLILVLILLVLVNPPKSNDDTKPPGNLIIEMRWADNCNSDVDLWVKAPGQALAVGFSNLSGEVINLLRDDLGSYGSLDKLNYENAYSRGIAPGEYIVNAHLYRVQRDCPLPMDVFIQVSMKSPTGFAKIIWSGKLTFTTPGEEQTAVRFSLDDEGNLMDNSILFLHEKISPLIQGHGQQ